MTANTFSTHRARAISARPAFRIDRLTAYRLAPGAHLRMLQQHHGRHVVLLHAVSGTVRLEGAPAEVLYQGDLMAIDDAAARTVAATVESEALMIVIPHECLGAHGAVLATTSVSIVSTSIGGTPTLAAQMLKAVNREIDSDAPGSLDAAADHLIGLIALAFAAAPGTRNPLPSDHLARAKAYIDDNLSDVALTPDRVAQHANVSTRTLHRSFEADGTTIGNWVRLRRLERCRRDLIDPHLVDLPVGAIGARWGLWDAAHFSRVFKQWTGDSPSAYRSAHQFAHASHGRRTA